MTVVEVKTSKAPEAIGPYAQALKVQDFIYTSGQIPVDPETGEIAPGIAEQTRQALSNIEAIVEEAGATKTNIVKTTVFMTDLSQFTAMNEVYAEFFGQHKPARSTVEVSKLPKEVLIEIEAIAVV